MSESLLLGGLLAQWPADFLTHIPISAAAACSPTPRPAISCCSALKLAERQWQRALTYSAAHSGVRARRGRRRARQAARQAGAPPGRRAALAAGDRAWSEVADAGSGGLLRRSRPEYWRSIPSISFVCAMQVETFRKVRGSAFATTMCTGNLRSGTEQLVLWRQTGDRKAAQQGAALLRDHSMVHRGCGPRRAVHRRMGRAGAAADLCAASGCIWLDVPRGRDPRLCLTKKRAFGRAFFVSFERCSGIRFR